MSPAAGPRLRFHLQWLLLTALAAGCYANTLQNGFVLDDEVVVVQDPSIRDLRNLPSYFQSGYWQGSLAARRMQTIGGQSYRPLATASFAVDHALWGLEPRGYHLTNLALHAAATLLLWVLLRRVLGLGPLAWGAAALFAVHPVHTEAVAAIAFRPELLSTLFAFGCLGAYSYVLPAGLLAAEPPGDASPATRRGTAAGLALSGIGLALALLCKESAITLPGLLAGLEALALARRAPGSDLASAARRATGRLLLVALLAGGYLVVRHAALGSLGSGFDSFASLGIPPSNRVATMLRVFGDYLRLMVWPHPLTVDYPENFNRAPNLVSLTDGRTLLAAVAVASALGAAISCLRTRPALGFFGLWFFVVLLPVSHLLPVMVIEHERLLYLPSAGACVCLAAGLLAAESRATPGMPRRLVRAGLCALLLGACLITFRRNRDWRDGLSLFAPLAERQPSNARAHMWLGSAYLAAGRADDAEASYDRMLELLPGNFLAHLLRGQARQRVGNHLGAIVDFDASIAASPRSAARLHRARSLSALGRDDEAWEDLREDRGLFPEDPEVAREYGAACLRRGLREEGELALREADRLTAGEGAGAGAVK
ncbi:MAG: tetratricopeptide repeat protein [Planctomycetes bacterium]|nr:tetratricopeptide repeat protein [Planctomycetota bacterium]